jgi:hypothetical protein
MSVLNASIGANHSSQAWNTSRMPLTLMIYITTAAPFMPLDPGYNRTGTSSLIATSQSTNRTSTLPHSLQSAIGIATSAPLIHLDPGYNRTGTSSLIATSPPSQSTISTSASTHGGIGTHVSTIHTSRSTPRKNNASLHIPSHVGIDMGDPIVGSTTLPDMNSLNHSKSIFFMEVLGPTDMASSVNGTILHSTAMGLTSSNMLMFVMSLFTSGLLVFMVALFLVSCAEGRRRSCTEEEECYGGFSQAPFHYDDKEKVW